MAIVVAGINPDCINKMMMRILLLLLLRRKSPASYVRFPFQLGWGGLRVPKSPELGRPQYTRTPDYA